MYGRKLIEFIGPFGVALMAAILVGIREIIPARRYGSLLKIGIRRHSAIRALKWAAYAPALLFMLALTPSSAWALLVNADNQVEITSDPAQIGEMFDITFTASDEDILNNFCFGDCGGLTLADFDGVTLDTTTWWTIYSITTSDDAGGDSISFIIDIVDLSTGWDPSAEVHSWGFNTDPDAIGIVAGTVDDVDGVATTSIWQPVTTAGNLGGFMIENCIFTPNNCQGGAGGMPLGTADQIMLTLSGDFFDGLLGTFFLEPDYAIKYQTGFGDELLATLCTQNIQNNCFQESLEISGFARIKVNEVPEPPTFILFIFGLLIIGSVVSRQRQLGRIQMARWSPPVPAS